MKYEVLKNETNNTIPDPTDEVNYDVFEMDSKKIEPTNDVENNSELEVEESSENSKNTIWSDDVIRSTLEQAVEEFLQKQAADPSLILNKAWLHRNGYNGLCRHTQKNKTQIEDYLSEKALQIWERRETEMWTDTKIRSTLDQAVEEFLQKQAENPALSFNPAWLRTNDYSGVCSHTQKNKTQIEDYLSEKALQIWERRETEMWTDTKIRSTLDQAVEEFLQKQAADPSLILNKAWLQRNGYNGLCRHTQKNKKPITDYLNEQGLFFWNHKGDKFNSSRDVEILEKYLFEVEDTSSHESLEFQSLLSLFGASKAIDILFTRHPEYKKIDLEKVKSSLASYLGDFLNSPLPFNPDFIEKGIPLLSEVSFQEALTEVIKSSALSYLHQRKSENTEPSDEEIIQEYIHSIRDKTATHNSTEVELVLEKVSHYYESLFNIRKPENIVDNLEESRKFPDTFQRINIKEIADKKRILLADEMGVGKSASAILAKESLGVRQAILIAPSNVLNTWMTYLSDQVDENGKQKGYFSEGKTPNILKVEHMDDLLADDLSHFDYILISQESMSEEKAEALKRLGAGMLIVDEVHKVKNIKEGVRSKSVMSLADSIQGEGKYLVALSGTPIPNKIEDLAISLKLLYPEQFSEIDNKKLVSQIIHSDVLTLRNLLVQRMQMKSLNESVEMPPLTENFVISELSETEKDLYEVLLEEDEVGAGVKMGLLRSFLLNPASIDALPAIESTKISDLQREVESFFINKERLVIFVNGYISNVIRGDKSFLLDFQLPEGIELRVIHAGISNEERATIQKDLHGRNKKMLVVVSGQTADVGVDFSAAQGVYEYNEPWTMADKRQHVSRAYRPGLEEELEYKTFIVKGTIEEGIHEYIQEKERIISKLIKGVPITELEQNFIEKSEKQDEIDLEINPELAEYYFSSWKKLLKIFASVKELGEDKFSEFLAKYGEDYAECYDQIGSRSYQANVNRVAGTIIANLVSETEQKSEDIKVLDIASGPEMLRNYAPEEIGGHIISLDRNLYQLRGSDSGRAVVGSFTKAPLKSGSFDYVNLGLALHYTRLVPSQNIYERLEVLTEINRVLKEGGKAVLSFIYSLDLKDEDQFEDIVEAFGFEIVEEYSGEVSNGENYKTKVITLEKTGEIKDRIDEIVDILLDGEVDGIKFNKTDTKLRDSRRTIDKFELNGKELDIQFNKEDFKSYQEERELIDQAEYMKLAAGGEIKDIPPDQLIGRGFTRFYNGKRYVLYKKLSNGAGSVVIR